jgi:NAD(P)-dependent dehydrogenase (short-subunit alcohol dehydrogenase family)
MLSTKILHLFVLLACLFLAEVTMAVTPKAETVLITGSNRGIGLALVQTFHQQGYQVIATARKPEKAVELKKLGVEVQQLDISNKASVQNLSDRLQGRSIDILLNNAGIAGHSTQKFKDLNIDRLPQVLDINSLGALRVTQALLPNLEKGSRKIVASISSKMGSIERNINGGSYGYRASKTALNSFNKSLSIEFGPQGYIFVVLHPGWVRTDMTNDSATYSTKESAEGLFAVISGLKKSDNGLFFDLHGQAISW